MRWGGDLEMRWLCSVTLLLHTARRLSHQNGLYKAAVEEARELGLVDGEDPPRPQGAPETPEQQKAFERSLSDWPEPEAPSFWPPENPTVIDEEYLLPDLNEFSAEPDSPKVSGEDSA
jgi:hypothetical protein